MNIANFDLIPLEDEQLAGVDPVEEAAGKSKEAKHTLGPWYWDEDTHGYGRGGLHPSVVTGTVEGLISVSNEDACLIAAAPELLEAARAFIETVDDLIASGYCKDDKKSLAARAAIAKATAGGQP